MAPIGCPLSERQIKVLQLMALHGLQSKGVARRLRLSESTVRQHMHNAYRKLGVTTGFQALVVCFNAGWLDPTATNIQRPTRYPDRTVTVEQHAYLKAFDRHLAAKGDRIALLEAKRRTDAAGIALDLPPRSSPSRDWMDRLLVTMRRIA